MATSNDTLFSTFFSKEPLRFLTQVIDLALTEDGEDFTSQSIFDPSSRTTMNIVAKQKGIIAGLPCISLIFERFDPDLDISTTLLVKEGSLVQPGTQLAQITGPTLALLKTERVILNLICHLSGIATTTHTFVSQMQNTKTRLLDTRKTTPGLRYPEKYAVLVGGGHNHRKNLEEMIMLKDNHVDVFGNIPDAVANARTFCRSRSITIPIEVECRTLDDVREAVTSEVDRIMLDNMLPDEIKKALAIIPDTIESELSGNVSLSTIHEIAALGADYISVGMITHSASSLDISMQWHKPI